MALIFDSGILRKLFGAEYNQIDTLPIDITITERVSLKAAVTDKPTEDGNVKTLGTVIQPLTILMRGVFNDNGDSWDEKKTKLEKIFTEGEPFTVVNSVGVYESMVIDAIDYDRDRTNKGSLFFDVSLRQITVISSRTVAAPSDFKKNASARDEGKKQPQQLDVASVDKARKTILAYGYDLITIGGN